MRVARDHGIAPRPDGLPWQVAHVRAVVGDEADATVIVLDDMHWVKQRHRDVFHQMVTRARERVAIIGTDVTLEPIRKHAGRFSAQELDRAFEQRVMRQRAASRPDELRRQRDEADH